MRNIKRGIVIVILILSSKMLSAQLSLSGLVKAENISVVGTVEAAVLSGSLSTTAQNSITSLSSLTALTVTGSITANTLNGTITTAIQPNITLLGQLTSLSVSGTIEAGILSGTLSAGAINSITSLALSNGFTVSGDISFNHNANFPTSINTGTSNGAVNIANGSGGDNIVSIGNIAGATGIVARVGTGNFSLDGATGSNYTIGASATSGIITIGGLSQTGEITIAPSTQAQIVNFANGATISSTVLNILSGAGSAGEAILRIANNQRATTVEIANVAPSATRTITIGGGDSDVADNINIGTGAPTVANGKTINIGTTAATDSGTVEITVGSVGTNAGAGVRFGNARFAINKPIAPTTGLTANTTATVTQILDAGIIGFRNNSGELRSLTLPTAATSAGLVQNLPGTPAVGDVFSFVVFNTGSTVISLVAGTGATISGPAGISGTTVGNSRTFYCRVTSITKNEETIVCY